MQADRTGVAVVDDDPDARLCLEDILREAEHFSCAGSFSNANDALHGIPDLHLRLVLMDINLPDVNGIECAKQLKRILPDVKIVMVSGLHEESWIEKSLQAGADAYLVKPVTPDQFLATLKCAIAERKLGGSNRDLSPETAQLLTPREIEVMRCLADGLLYKEISDKLKISVSAVHKHQHTIFQKFRVANRSEAIRKWLDAC
jgi:DNA-binding NarL/FixJ family response regulator